MQFEVLGPLRVVGTDREPVAIPSAVQRRLLSLLILRAGTPVSADHLAECMDISGGALRVAVSRLRRLVGFATLVTAPPGYELRAECIDTRAFEDLLARAARDNGTARRSLEDALSLWRGDAYAEFSDEGWAVLEVRRLAELRAGATEDLVELMLDAGEWTAAIAAVEPLISEQPFRDRPRALLMRALADSGRRIDALRAYQTYRQTLLDEVGTEPSETIMLLDREIARSGATDIVPRWSPSSATGESVGTFLFTDIVGSTRLWAEQAEAMSVDLAVHDDVLSCAIADHGGMTISKGGDSFAAAFERADDAVAAAVAAQQLLAATDWQIAGGVPVRMGVHVGAAQRRGDGWYGPPLNEAARMMAVAHGGQIVVSERVATIVSDVGLVDLGEHRLRDLDGTHHLFQVLAPGLRGEFPSLGSMSRYVTTLPTQRTELVGRDELTARVRALLLEQRLVTLLGPGGVGKTRVAVEVAGQELENYPDGVFFVDLTTAATDADVVAAFITGVRTTVPSDQEAGAHLAKYLAERPALLVADNCEHVVDRVAEVLDGLLSAAPDLRVLATSRETLDLDGEHCVVVPSLEVDGVRSAGAHLFTERALAVDDSFVVDRSTLETVAEIARRLDGIPLAIELAAAQIRTLTPSQILMRLDDRFQFLRRGNRQAPPRQRTLEAAVAWSYELLDADEQRAFRFLSVCAGRFGLATAARLLEVDEVTALLLLDALVTKSLIASIRVGGESHGYRFLETLRDYGRRELTRHDEWAAVTSALESALVPPPELLDDWMELENRYFFASDVTIIVEDVTRRAAATRALEAGRLDAAALIFSSCAFRDDPGGLDATLRLVAPLADRRDTLHPTAWRAACATKLILERSTRRYDACFTTAIDMSALLEVDDPARRFFDMWQWALTAAVAPQVGIAGIDECLPRLRAQARQPFDATLSDILASKVTGLAIMGRLDEARIAAEETLAVTPDTLRDQALANITWIAYLLGITPNADVQREVASRSPELGLAQLCVAPAALCGDRPVEARAADLVAGARRRPPTDVPTPFLLAFAWLAVEDGDSVRAAELVATAELYDASTHIGLTFLLSKLEGWTDDSWDRSRDRAIGRFLSEDHHRVAKQGTAVLAAEVERWEHILRRTGATTLDA